jgi:hypothetical protein
MPITLRRRRNGEKNLHGGEIPGVEVGFAFEAIARAYIAAGMGAGAFLRAAKRRFALAAARDIAENAPAGKRVSVSRVAAATGLTRKEIPSLLRLEESATESRTTFESLLSPSAKLTRAWRSRADLTDLEGKPLDIPYSKGRGSFCALARSCTPDITPVSMLKELEMQGTIKILRSRKIRLVGQSDAKLRLKQKELMAFEIGLERFADQLYKKLRKTSGAIYLETDVAENLSPPLASLFVRHFSERARVLLDAIPKWVDANTSERKPHERSKSIGVGVYLYEDNFLSGKSFRDSAAKPGSREKVRTTPRAKRA